ncbi:MAG: 5-methylcytosine-specific restriction endonuclease system specificity protein McrC [Patescibacteria group bacterium]|nr:5-methylcytosine-specific restriction endonuclease system specificity protein McrC [Patescibacteria group bacterium]MEA3497284.1 5-methylcytosine-specific restriction endonuclease system specificity protein McrC [Bacteroidota bacterium]
MEIPIINIYYLLCYAWDKLEEKDVVNVKEEDHTKLLDLFAKILINGMNHLIRKGLDRNYIDIKEDSKRIKGKINFNETLKRNLLVRCEISCEFDDFSYNILHNRIIKTVIGGLVRNDEVDQELRDELNKIYRLLKEIDEIRLSSKIFNAVKLNRNNYFYDFLIKVCRLIYENYLITEETGKGKFRDFIRDEVKMRMLFEDFVRNFYRKEQNEFSVTRELIAWNVKAENDEDMSYMPRMETDISLKSKSKKIIVDTKYYKEAIKGQYKNKEKLISNNLYQMFAYINNIENKGGLNKKCTGILLYPTVKKDLDLKYKIPNHNLQIKTINLNQEWKKIHKDLLSVIMT